MNPASSHSSKMTIEEKIDLIGGTDRFFSSAAFRAWDCLV